MELLLVFGRLILSLACNVYQKKLAHQGLHPFFIVASIYVVISLISLPFLSVISIQPLNQTFWLNIFLASVFDVLGWMLLVMSLSKTDLSVLGPLNAYKVIFSLLFAIAFLNEIPNLQGIIGVFVIIVGSFFLTPAVGHTQWGKISSLLKEKGVQARFLSILLFSIGTVFLKNAVMIGGPLSSVVFWSLIGLPLVMICNHLVLPQSFKSGLPAAKAELATILSVGVMIFAMQYLTLVLISHMLVAYALALFQLGMVLQVFIGYKVFKEKDIGRKLIASIVMMLGSVMVLLA